MDANAVAGAGVLTAFILLACTVFLIALFAAPIKLYSIHRDIRRTNDLLRQQVELLADIEERNRVQVGLLAVLAKVPVESIPAKDRRD